MRSIRPSGRPPEGGEGFFDEGGGDDGGGFGAEGACGEGDGAPVVGAGEGRFFWGEAAFRADQDVDFGGHAAGGAEDVGDALVGFECAGEQAGGAGFGGCGDEGAGVERVEQFGADVAAALLGGFGGEAAPASLAGAFAADLGALGPDGLDGGDAEFGGFFDDEVEAVGADHGLADDDAGGRWGGDQAGGGDFGGDGFGGAALDAEGVDAAGWGVDDFERVVAAEAEDAVEAAGLGAADGEGAFGEGVVVVREEAGDEAGAAGLRVCGRLGRGGVGVAGLWHGASVHKAAALSSRATGQRALEAGAERGAAWTWA